MKANHHSGVAVRLPNELRAIIENMAEARGESLSLIIRDLLREATAARRGVQAVLQVAPDNRPAPTTGAFR
jgi:Ribbon-helix-helix protein, copG family